MPIRWRSSATKPPPPPPQPSNRSVSAVLLDFVFGEPVPQPEVVEHDSEQAWQDWLDATASMDAGNEFEDTQPMAAEKTRPAAPS